MTVAWYSSFFPAEPEKKTTVKMRIRKQQPDDLVVIPETLSPEQYLRHFGADCEEYSDKFGSVEQIFSMSSLEMKKSEIPLR